MPSIQIGNQVVRERVEDTNRVLKYADESKTAGLYTDICIKTEKKSFRAHRLVLSCYSLYFRTRFEAEIEDKYGGIMEIESEYVNEISLESIINFIYIGKLCISQENVCELFAASNYLQVDQAKQFCLDFLTNSISIETWFQVFKMAYFYKNDHLSSKVFRFIEDNFAKISSTNDFKFLSKRSLLHIFSQLDSHRVFQRLIYDAIIAWVKHNESRKEDFAELFKQLDLKKFSPIFLTKTVSTEILIKENQLCSSLVMDTLAMKLQERVSEKLFKILSIGGTKTRNKIFVVYNNDQQVYPALPQEFTVHYALKVDSYVYCIGGNNTDPNKVFRLNLHEQNMDWERVTLMRVGREYFAAAAYSNGIAVVGGLSSDASNLAEFYNPLQDKWSELPLVNIGRCEPTLVTCNGCLFCLGGYQEDDHGNRTALSSVEKLSDVSGPWEHFESMQTSRSVFAAVTCMDTIYAIGGRDDQLEVMRSVEKYDFDQGKWVNVKPMNCERREHSACVIQDKIFVVGGTNANNLSVSEIECYDPHSDSWTVVGSTNEELLRHTIIAI